MTDGEIEQRIAHGTINFIINSLDSSIPDQYIKFKSKYGIGLLKENCVIDPMTFERVTTNNKRIYKYLNNKYGSMWQNELPVMPFGIN